MVLTDMPSLMAQFETHAFLHRRQQATANGLPIWPTMEESNQALPAQQAGLDQALAVIELLEAHPQLASHIPPGGVPPQ